MNSTSIAALAAALAKAQGEMKPASMDATNPFYKSRYASLPSLWESIRVPLSANGLSVIQMPLMLADGKIGVRTILMHSSGEWISTDTEAGCVPDKTGPQALGVITTYLRRYSLAAMVGQVAEEDDDAEAVTTHAPAREAAPAKAQTQTTGGTPGGITDKQRKMLWALGCQLWYREDEHGEIKPDKERIVRELEQRSLDMGFEFASITSKGASALIEIFTDLKKKADAAKSPNTDGLPF